MKRIFAFILVVASAFAFVGCSSQEKAKNDIFDLVEKNYDVILKACEEKNVDMLSVIDGITMVEVVDGYVLVYCKGAGIAPSSQDYGFYYSEENSPAAVDCNLYILCDADELTPDGNGYQYVESGNVFYTEHIKGNIYFYRNAY